MKIKSCYFARFVDSEDMVKEFTENYNCTIRHRLPVVDGAVIYTIEDATGNKSVITVFPEGVREKFKSNFGVRIVVDDIREAIEYFKAQGYEAVHEPIESASNIICAMNKGTEYRLIFEHKKQHS